MTNISDRIASVIKERGISIRAFEQLIGCSNGVISRCINKGTDIQSLWVSKIIETCGEINSEWLLTGNGPMLKDRSNGILPELVRTDPTKGQNYIPPTTPLEATHKQEAIPLTEIGENSEVKPIPLVTETAAAGFGNEHFSIAEKDVKDYYVIPKFRLCHVDFMIEVSGLSMFPHFNPGDVIACTILNDRKFLQWNKCHVIATREQGILVKRIMPSKSDGYLTAVSDNKDYPPFDIPVDDITGLALVVGSVSLE